MAIKQFLSICLSMVTVSCVTIWNDPMNNSSTQSNWTGTGIQAQRNVEYCPDQIDGPCRSVCNGYIYRTASTMTYEHITLTFDLDPHQMTSNAEQCIFSYSTDNSNSIWTPFYQVNGDAHIINHTETLDLKTENNIGISIKIEAVGDTVDSCCWLSNLKLQGNIIAASNDFIISPSFNKTTYFNANTLCQNTYGTDLATISTFNANKKALAICRDFCNSKGQDSSNCACWIGLYRHANQTVWHWQDNTPIGLFGFDVNGDPVKYAAPWWTDGRGSDPNVAITSNTYVRMGQVANTWTWGDTIYSQSYYPLCGAPTTPHPTTSPTYIPTNNPSNNPSNILQASTYEPSRSTVHPTTYSPSTQPSLLDLSARQADSMDRKNESISDHNTNKTDSNDVDYMMFYVISAALICCLILVMIAICFVYRERRKFKLLKQMTKDMEVVSISKNTTPDSVDVPPTKTPVSSEAISPDVIWTNVNCLSSPQMTMQTSNHVSNTTHAQSYGMYLQHQPNYNNYPQMTPIEPIIVTPTGNPQLQKTETTSTEQNETILNEMLYEKSADTHMMQTNQPSEDYEGIIQD